MYLTRAPRLAACAVACVAALLLAGCGSQSSSSGSSPSSDKTHTMADGQKMTDSQMKEMDSSKDASKDADPDKTSAPGQVTHRTAGPSEPAGMICSLEIAEAVKRVYALPALPKATDDWAAAQRLYTCTYQLPTGTLRLSVKDLDAGAAGTAYFTTLQKRLDATRITGLQNLGFPAFQTRGATGSVGFLKDGKTLWVDAGRVAPSDLPPGFTRTGTAYAVAAAILACWTD